MSSIKDLVADIYPLSPMQQGMLFHSLYAPGSGVYFLQTACRLRGQIDAEALQMAWQRAVQRHSILRTAFLWENLEQPVQVVFKRADLPLQRLDWRQLPPGRRQSARRAMLNADRRQGFDLAKPPLLRLFLAQLDDNLHEMIFSHHHLLLDAWSGPQLFGEVLAEYQALRRRDEIQLPARRPFRDYIAWLQQQDLKRAEAFWKEWLKGFQAPTPLPCDRPASDRPTPPERYGTLCRRLTPQATRSLESLARRCLVTLNIVVQSAWALLLSRSSAERDVLFGLVTAGRPAQLPGAQEMIGLFINTLPMRVRIEPSDKMMGFWQRLQARQADLQQFEHSPLVRIQGWSEVPPSQPLFDNIFIFANYPSQLSEGGNGSGLEIEGFESLEQTHYPLTLEARVDRRPEPVLELKAYYEFERFDAATIHRLLEQWSVLLERMPSSEQSHPLELDPLTPAARHQLTREWAQAAPAPTQATLHQLFERQAADCPDGVALSDGEGQVSYGELDRRANQLAWLLDSAGAAPEVLVGLRCGRSLEMPSSMLGILKAGAAYLPLDPDMPSARLRFMLQDARPAVIVTQHAGLQRQGLEGARSLAVDSDWPSIASQPSSPPDRRGRFAADASCTAYVIYTSGSTGRPKGTLISHANAVRLFESTDRWFGFGAGDVWTLFHSFAFDFSVWEIWGALLYGGRLAVVSHAVSRSPEAFYELLAEQQVTVLNQTPSAFRQLVQAESDRPGPAPLALGWIVFGGEPVDLTSLPLWFRRHDQRRPQLVNMYGITETTVHVTWRPLQPSDAEGILKSPIGAPIPDLEIYLLDGQGQPQPLGAVGEIFVGGAGLARGYLKRPSLTAERFVPHPFSLRPGARLYRSGDLARRLADGELEHLGRADQQLKVRGFRIEPGEIESALTGHAQVAQAVATLDRRTGQDRLVGYVVPQSGAQPSASGLLRLARRKLPEYMVPSALVFLERLPLTPTGKLDRRALPAPEVQRPQMDTDFVAPRSEMERRIATVWCEVLSLGQVGVHDNFFEIGGHSLAMIQAVGKLRRALERPIAVIDAFRHPTVHQLAAYCSDQGGPSSLSQQRQEVAEELSKGKLRRQQRLQRQRQAQRRPM